MLCFCVLFLECYLLMCLCFLNNAITFSCRCRHGYFHVVNNDYTHWEMYAIGGSANPTINSQGNRYAAPKNPFAKEVITQPKSVRPGSGFLNVSLWHLWCLYIVFNRWLREWTHRQVTGKDGIGDRKEICFKTVLTSLLQEPLRPVATHVPPASPQNLRHWSDTLLPTLELYLVAEDVNVPHSSYHPTTKIQNYLPLYRQKCTFSHICHLKSQLSFFFFRCVCLCRFFSTSGLLASTAS